MEKMSNINILVQSVSGENCVLNLLHCGED